MIAREERGVALWRRRFVERLHDARPERDVDVEALENDFCLLMKPCVEGSDVAISLLGHTTTVGFDGSIEDALSKVEDAAAIFATTSA